MQLQHRAAVLHSVFLINHAGILQNLGSNMGPKSVLNQLFNTFRALGSVRNGFAIYFSCRLSPPKLRTASKSSQNQSFPLNHSGMIKEKHRVLLLQGPKQYMAVFRSPRSAKRVVLSLVLLCHVLLGSKIVCHVLLFMLNFHHKFGTLTVCCE